MRTSTPKKDRFAKEAEKVARSSAQSKAESIVANIERGRPAIKEAGPGGRAPLSGAAAAQAASGQAGQRSGASARADVRRAALQRL